MAAKVADSSKTMLAAYVTEWLDVGTVPDKVSFGNVPAPATPQKSQVLIDVKAASINVSDIALLQDTGAGGWCYHTRKPTVAAPLVVPDRTALCRVVCTSLSRLAAFSSRPPAM